MGIIGHGPFLDPGFLGDDWKLRSFGRNRTLDLALLTLHLLWRGRRNLHLFFLLNDFRLRIFLLLGRRSSNRGRLIKGIERRHKREVGHSRLGSRLLGLVLRLGGLRSSGGGGLHDWRRYNRGFLYRCDSRLGWVAVIDDRALNSSAHISAVWTIIVREKKPYPNGAPAWLSGWTCPGSGVGTPLVDTLTGVPAPLPPKDSMPSNFDL